jgi:anti-sigma-K factor RskA
VTHEEIREALAAYALDALDAEARRTVETHLHTCAECAAEVEALRGAAAALAVGVPPTEPSPGLRDRVMAAVRDERTGAGVRRLWVAGLAAAAALAVVFAGLSLALYRELVAQRAELARQGQLIAMLGSPSTRAVTLQGTVEGNVRFVYDPDRGQGMLVVTQLRDPGRGFVYQLWLVAGQTPESAGVFRPTPARPVLLPVTADLRRYGAVAVSIERAPAGAPRPTAPPVLSASL